MLLFSLFAVFGVFVGHFHNQPLTTNLNGSALVLGNSVVSLQPGSGRNVVSFQNNLLWKECPPDDQQRIVSHKNGIVFQREYFSGPFAFGTTDLFLVSVPGEILLLDTHGVLHTSFHTGEYPGSICSDAESIWFVSSDNNTLKKIDVATGNIDTVSLPFTPLTVDTGGDYLLIRKASGGSSVTDKSGNPLLDIPEGFLFRFTEGNAVSYLRASELDGFEVKRWEGVVVDVTTGRETVFQLSPEQLNYHCSMNTPKDDPTAHFDVPYVHQRWDSPDWFNGSWSCGPTSCLMAVQYYNRLTPDSIWCSSPTGHWSQWGNYIPTEYTFLGYTYDVLGVSPGDVWVPGIHGFICRSVGGAIWNEMTDWMSQHGLVSFQLGTTWGACTAELSNSWPVVASTTSALTSGHILTFNGYYDNHSVICNDSYGDQNQPGWGNQPNGKDVVYDWPGYNNGNVELSISMLFAARSEVLAPPGSLVDDRTTGYRKLGPCQYWHEQTTGFDGYSWWTYSTGAPPDTCVVEWIPDLPSESWYLVETYVPSSHATATGIYHINSTSGWVTATLDQNNHSDEWVSLGTFFLSPATASVKMGDYTGTQGRYISFDAVRFTLQSSIGDEQTQETASSFGILSNPVAASSQIVFTLPEDYGGMVNIYDSCGRITATVRSSLPSGSLVPGLYHAVIERNGSVTSLRFVVTP